MGYRKRHDFTTPSADEMLESRNKMLWIFSIYFLQPAFFIFLDNDASPIKVFMSAGLWAIMLIVILWVLVGLPTPGLSERDRAKVDDEWSRFTTGDACRWGMAALGAMTIGAMFLGLWVPIEADEMLYAVTNGAIFTSLVRLAWLSRESGSDEDE